MSRGVARGSPRKGVVQIGEDGCEQQETIWVCRPPGLPATQYLALDHRGNIVVVMVGVWLVCLFRLSPLCGKDSGVWHWMLETMAESVWSCRLMPVEVEKLMLEKKDC